MKEPHNSAEITEALEQFGKASWEMNALGAFEEIQLVYRVCYYRHTIADGQTDKHTDKQIWLTLTLKDFSLLAWYFLIAIDNLSRAWRSHTKVHKLRKHWSNLDRPGGRWSPLELSKRSNWYLACVARALGSCTMDPFCKVNNDALFSSCSSRRSMINLCGDMIHCRQRY